MQQLNLILQGGGTRCAYQLSFLNKIIKNIQFNNIFKINNVVGTSFGAIVGYFYCIDKMDILYDFFMKLNKNSLQPHFDLWGYKNIIIKIPFIGNIVGVIIDMVWIIKSIVYKGLYDQTNQINTLLNIELNTQQKQNLKKYYCCVYNITKQKIEYINGTHPLLLDYIIASSSLWIVFKPKLIKQLKSECICDENCVCYKTKNDKSNDYCDCHIETHKFNEFMDGGILKPIPYEKDDTYDGKYLILTTKDLDKINNKNFIFKNSGRHLFEYLDNIITFLVEYHQHLDMKYINKEWHKNNNVYLINYKPKNNDPLLLNKEIITEYINDGNHLADNFLKDTVFGIPAN